MEQITIKGQNIVNFKVGEIITRVERAEIYRKQYNENIMVTVDVLNYTDGSYMGEPLEYKGIANNKIYFQPVKGCLNNKVRSVNLEDWQDGWSMFTLPEGVTMDDI